MASRRSRDRHSTFLARGSPPRHVAAFSTANPRSLGEAGRFVAFSEALRVPRRVRALRSRATRESVEQCAAAVAARQSVNFYRVAVPRESINCHWSGEGEATFLPISPPYIKSGNASPPLSLSLSLSLSRSLCQPSCRSRYSPPTLPPHSHSCTEFATRDDSSICITGCNSFYSSLSLSLSLSFPATLARETSLGVKGTVCVYVCTRVYVRVHTAQRYKVHVCRGSARRGRPVINDSRFLAPFAFSALTLTLRPRGEPGDRPSTSESLLYDTLGKHQPG